MKCIAHVLEGKILSRSLLSAEKIEAQEKGRMIWNPSILLRISYLTNGAVRLCSLLYTVGLLTDKWKCR